MRSRPGELAVRRHFMRGHDMSRAWCGRVAADDERGLWLWFATGSAFRDIGAVDGRPFREVPFDEWGRTERAMRELRWTGDVLMLHPPGAAYSVWFFFRGADNGFDGWYVNLERPGARWATDTLTGIDTVDYDLDVVVAPDRTWRWKDEDEFLAHLAVPDVYWCDDEQAGGGADLQRQFAYVGSSAWRERRDDDAARRDEDGQALQPSDAIH